MARATLTKTTPLGKRTDKYTANAADLTMAAANVSDKNQFVASGKDLVFAHNTSGASAYTITIDHTGSDDITAYSLGIGEYAIFGPLELDGWCQADVKVYLEASNAAILFGVIDLSNF